MQTTLKAQRTKLGLTQNDIASKIGISPISYQRYESNKRIPDAKTAVKLVKVLNSTVEDIFGEEANQNNAETQQAGPPRKQGDEKMTKTALEGLKVSEFFLNACNTLKAWDYYFHVGNLGEADRCTE